MTTISQIITDAYRESNLIAVGTSPTTAEVTEALRLLNRIVRNLFGYEFGETLRPLPLGKASIATPDMMFPYMDDFLDAYVPENTRLLCNLEETREVNLTPNPSDGSRVGLIDVSENFATYNLTINGNGRTIEDVTSLTLSTDALIREWFYRADLGDWVRLSDLTEDGNSPFPEEFDDLLILHLAFRLSPRQGAEMATVSQAQMVRLEKKFRARYKQKEVVDSEDGLLKLPSRTGWIVGSSTNAFNRGIPRW